MINIIRVPTKEFYGTVYNSTSEDKDEEMFVNLKRCIGTIIIILTVGNSRISKIQPLLIRFSTQFNKST